MYKTNQKGDLRKLEAFSMRILDLMTSEQSNVDATEDAKSSDPASK